MSSKSTILTQLCDFFLLCFDFFFNERFSDVTFIKMVVKNNLKELKKKGRRSVLFPYISEMVKIIANLFHSIVIILRRWAILAPADPYLGNYHKS
jgi:hypothetical protein